MISSNILHIPERIGECKITLADNTKLSQTFGWKPQVDLEQWIRSNL
jgi:UDP-glucose 4-epimerase